MAQAAGQTPTDLEVRTQAGGVVRWPLKVVVFNAHGGRRLETIVALLRDHPVLRQAAVLMLCEADRGLARSNRRHVAAEIAGALEMSYAHGPEFSLRPETAETAAPCVGNALLSRAPLTGVELLALPGRDAMMRSFGMVGTPKGLIAKVVVEGLAVRLGVAHLDSRWSPTGRELQMRVFLESFAGGGPAIIGGDWNTTTANFERPDWLPRLAAHLLLDPRRLRRPERYEPLFRRLGERGFHMRGANARLKPTFTPSALVPSFLRPKLDWLAARGLRPLPGSAAAVPARGRWGSRRISDHDFVVCSFEPPA